MSGTLTTRQLRELALEQGEGALSAALYRVDGHWVAARIRHDPLTAQLVLESLHWAQDVQNFAPARRLASRPLGEDWNREERLAFLQELTADALAWDYRSAALRVEPWISASFCEERMAPTRTDLQRQLPAILEN